MKLVRLKHFAARSGAILFACAAAMAIAPSASGQESESDALRAGAKKLLQQAGDLKEKGREDEANKLAREAERLERQANQIGKERRKESIEKLAADSPKKTDQIQAKIKELLAQGRADEAAKLKAQMENVAQRSQKEDGERRELAKRLKEMKQEIDELQQSGRHEEARNLEQKAQQIRQKAEAMKQTAHFSPDGSKIITSGDREVRVWDGAMGREIRKPFQSPAGMPVEAEQRLHHLRAAIENLHAAGLHEAAERLEQDSQKLKLQLQHERAAQFQHGRDEVIHDLHNEIRELRQAVQSLRSRVEELSRRGK